MIYPLHKKEKSNHLTASTSSYTEEYAQRMCDLYLKDELAKNEEGRVKKYYRLYATKDHTQTMALAYDVQCPQCKNNLKQIGKQISFNKLGLYVCPICGK